MEDSQARGFTLIELLIVIGVIALLSAAVILTLNPAELLKQSRDSNRISDFAALKSAVSLYIADVLSPNLASSSQGYAGCYMSMSFVTSSRCGGFLNPLNTYYINVTSSLASGGRAVDATGWLPVNLVAISSGAPFSNLPVDPVNSPPFYYAYAASSSPTLVYKFVTDMESSKFSNGGKRDVESIDGGSDDSLYETGSDPGLDL